MPTLAEEKALYVVDNSDAKEEEVVFKNPIRELGFAQIEHIIGLDTDLSDGAYRTLSILHYFWQQKKSAYPSIETLAKLRGKSERTISEHLAELETKQIITRARRMGTSSMTYLEDLPQEYKDAAAAILTERMQKTARKTGRKLHVVDAENFQQRITREEEQEKKSPAAANGIETIGNETQNPFKVWESVGMALTAYIMELLADMEKEYTSGWVCEAIRRAAKQNKKNINYVDGILKRWKRDGKMDYPERTEQFTRPPDNAPRVNMEAVILQ